MQVGASQRAAAATFDHSRLAEFSEQIQYDAPAVQQTPLVQVTLHFHQKSCSKLLEHNQVTKFQQATSKLYISQSL